MGTTERTPFEEEAARAKGGLARELWVFLRRNRKWWLAPILLALLLAGLMLLAGTSGAAPFIYALF